MMVSAFPEWWRSKFQGLRTIALPPQLPLMDGDIADLQQKADELMSVAEQAFDTFENWQWSYELSIAMAQIGWLAGICNTEITAEFEPTEALFVPGFCEDFGRMWADAGQVAS